MNNIIKKNYNNLLFRSLVYSVIWTFVAHGMGLFNKYSFHDDTYSFNNVGTTIESGRWMLEWLNSIVHFLCGSAIDYSLPLLNGLITTFFISIMLFFVFDYLKIENRLICFLISGIMISFPTITGIYAFVYTAPYYYFGAMIAVFGAYCYFKHRNWISMIICVILMACAVGIYQANISICICTLLLFFISDTYGNNYGWKKYITEGVKLIVICIGFMAVYFIVNAIVLSVADTSMLDYKGVNSFGVTGIKGYLRRVVKAYKEFFVPTQKTNANMYPFSAAYINISIIIIGIVMIIFLFVKNKNNFHKIIQMILLLLLYPLASYFIYVMVDVSEIHSLMTYGEAFGFLLVAWILDKSDAIIGKKVIFKKILYICLSILLFLNVRLSNICYLKAEFLQSQAISYYNTLIANITSIDGYDDELPVIYLNEYKKDSKRLTSVGAFFTDIYITPYDKDTVINDYVWKRNMKLWCGYSPWVRESSVIDVESDEVKNMPNYPDKGSIKIIDGNVVVKF